MKRKWELAWRGLKGQPWMNLLIVVQLVITFFISISFISIFQEKYAGYAAIETLSAGTGTVFFHHGIVKQDGMFVQDSSELEEMLPGSTFVSCYSVMAEVNFGEEKLPLEVRAYDQEIIDAYRPRMEEGQWLEDCDGEEILHVVVSQGSGLQVGDRLDLESAIPVDPGIENVHLPAVVSGVLDADAYVPGFQVGDPERRDSSWLFQSANPEYGSNQLLLINESELLRVKENLGCLVISGEMGNLTWMSRPADMMESQKKAQDDMLGMMLQSVEMEVDFQELRENTEFSFREDMLQIVPVFLVALLVTFLSEISAGAIAARTQMYRYGIYQLCGLSVKGCLGIHVRGSGLLTGIAFVLAVLGAWGMERFGWAVGGTVIRLGWMQAAGGLLVAAVNLAIACWIPLRIIRDRSVYETLYKEK